MGNINSGLLADWNVQHPDACVSKKCRIISVNGISESASDMREALRGSLSLTIVIKRPTVCEYFRNATCMFGSVCRNVHEDVNDITFSSGSCSPDFLSFMSDHIVSDYFAPDALIRSA